MKKIISLMMITTIVLSMCVTAGAATYDDVKLSVVLSDVFDFSGQRAVAATVQFNKFFDSAMTKANIDSGSKSINDAINGFGAQISYDTEKLTYLGVAEETDIQLAEKGLMGWKNISYTTGGDPIVGMDGKIAVSVTTTNTKAATVADTFNTGTLAILYFTLNDSYTTGETEIGIDYGMMVPKVGDKILAGTQEQAGETLTGDAFHLVAGTLDLGGEEEPTIPENTTVATFPKRLYVNDTLYTVGIITEGKNFATETVKAGINIEKGTEGATVNYWTNEDLVSKAGKSYYAVGLKDVTTTTQITPESASKAVIIVNDAAPVYGAAVTGNSLTTDKDPEIVLE